MEKRMLLKIQNANLLPKGGGNDQPSLEHKIFLHLFITREYANVPKYIFKHMIQQLRESQEKNRCWIPYGRLLSEIFHKGGILKALSNVNFFTDAQLGLETGRIINGGTLRHMSLIGKDDYKKLRTDMQESDAVSALMKDFPPICNQDALEVKMHFIKEHFETTRTKISVRDVPEEMYGGALPVAKSRKTKRKEISKEAYLEEGSEQVFKKAKKDKKKKSSSEQLVDSELPTIQEEAQDLNAEEILENRTKSSKDAATSQAASEQPAIPKKKRKHAIRKLRMAAAASNEEEEVDATELVTREVKKKQAEDAAAL
ncbi:hypothetical protein MtrunA17_Chr2g0307161 [Medicago truncatula]|uniref:Uncharacterized protein n=1 Tax=Medicago truncatula TaxID=3880 RepID=A0A396JCY6_MEDTR|nr:hypothetical protein MtrunA17_Chr2g0307161 [Medicago truncatula]